MRLFFYHIFGEKMKILRLAEVIKMTGLSRSTIYKLMKDGEFVLSVKISTKSVGWLDFEVLNWMESRLETNDIEKEKSRNEDGTCF